MSAQDCLSLTRSRYLAQNLSPQGQRYDKLVIAAAIFHPSYNEDAKILLLKRAAHESAYPNVFEIPGGNVEDTDANLLSTLKREVEEETALLVTEVTDVAIAPFSYSIEKEKVEPSGEKVVTTKTTLQLNFVCEVIQTKFQVNPEEHSLGRWVSEDEIAALDITDLMRGVIQDAFKWKVKGSEEV